jgi:hypothetical protein
VRWGAHMRRDICHGCFHGKVGCLGGGYHESGKKSSLGKTVMDFRMQRVFNWWPFGKQKPCYYTLQSQGSRGNSHNPSNQVHIHLKQSRCSRVPVPSYSAMFTYA